MLIATVFMARMISIPRQILVAQIGPGHFAGEVVGQFRAIEKLGHAGGNLLERRLHGGQVALVQGSCKRLAERLQIGGHSGEHGVLRGGVAGGRRGGGGVGQWQGRGGGQDGRATFRFHFAAVALGEVGGVLVHAQGEQAGVDDQVLGQVGIAGRVDDDVSGGMFIAVDHADDGAVEVGLERLAHQGAIVFQQGGGFVGLHIGALAVVLGDGAEVAAAHQRGNHLIHVRGQFLLGQRAAGGRLDHLDRVFDSPLIRVHHSLPFGGVGQHAIAHGEALGRTRLGRGAAKDARHAEFFRESEPVLHG